MNSALYRSGPRSPDEIAASTYLINTVFELKPSDRKTADPTSTWSKIGIFLQSDCVAACEIARYSLITARENVPVGAIRHVCVASRHRGTGLLHRLLPDAIAAAEGAQHDPVLLYAEKPSLYERWGFTELDQHAFRGAVPPFASVPLAREIPSPEVIARLVNCRAPLSRLVSLDAPDLAISLCCACLDDEGPFEVIFLPDLDVILLLQRQERRLVLADVIGPAIPTMAQILAALAEPFEEVSTLFAPDQLCWAGDPVSEPNGLMARGSLPPACDQPFMLPPTADF